MSEVQIVRIRYILGRKGQKWSSMGRFDRSGSEMAKSGRMAERALLIAWPNNCLVNLISIFMLIWKSYRTVLVMVRSVTYCPRLSADSMNDHDLGAIC